MFKFYTVFSTRNACVTSKELLYSTYAASNRNNKNRLSFYEFSKILDDSTLNIEELSKRHTKRQLSVIKDAHEQWQNFVIKYFLTPVSEDDDVEDNDTSEEHVDVENESNNVVLRIDPPQLIDSTV